MMPQLTGVKCVSAHNRILYSSLLTSLRSLCWILKVNLSIRYGWLGKTCIRLSTLSVMVRVYLEAHKAYAVFLKLWERKLFFLRGPWCQRPKLVQDSQASSYRKTRFMLCSLALIIGLTASCGPQWKEYSRKRNLVNMLKESTIKKCRSFINPSL